MTVLAWVLWAACSSAPVPDAAPARPVAQRVRTVTLTPAAAPERAAPTRGPHDDLRAVLRARHPSDLPTAADLRARPGAAEALRWWAVHADTAVVARRARALLGHVARPEDVAFLIAAARDDGAAHVRAGAVVGLGRVGTPAARDALVEVVAAEADATVWNQAADALRALPDAAEAVGARRLDATGVAAERLTAWEAGQRR